MLKSLRLRLALWMVAAVVVSLATIWYVLAGMFASYVQDRYQTEMSALADSVIAKVFYENGAFQLESNPDDPRLDLPAGGRYWQLSAGGQADIRSQSLWDTVIDPAAIVENESGFGKIAGPDGGDLLVFSTTARLADEPGFKAGSLTVFAAFPEAEYSSAMTTFHEELTRMIIIAGLMLTLGGLVLVVTGLAPLDRLRRDVAGIRAGELPSIKETGPSEVRPLVREINELLVEREKAVERARARASDLAHGLKTPLTVLSQLASELSPEAHDLVIKQVDLIRQRADRQLQAARLGAEQMAATELSEIVVKLIHVLSPVTRPKGIDWDNRVKKHILVRMDPADLAEALGNVMDNAGKWASTRIEVEAKLNGDSVDFSVSDDGPGVNADEREKVLERGVHLDQPESSTGLGLSITNDIVVAYGGTMKLTRAKQGGLCVTLSIPQGQSKPQISPA